MEPGIQEMELQFADILNNRHMQERANDSELSARIRSFETAFHMQTMLPKRSISGARTLGRSNCRLQRGDNDGFGWQCLVARRLESNGSYDSWKLVDGIAAAQLGPTRQHGRTPDHAKVIDKTAHRLLLDLKARGMLDETLVVWTTEFGRTPESMVRRDEAITSACFSSWLAGGGVRGGISFGETDEIGAKVADNGVHVHDFPCNHSSSIGHRPYAV